MIDFILNVANCLLKMRFNLFDEPCPFSVDTFVKSVCGKNAAGNALVDALGFIDDKAFSVKHSFLFVLINDDRAHNIIIRIRNDCDQEIDEDDGE